MPKLIRSWDELVGLESDNYRLEIDTKMGNGHIVPKTDSEDSVYGSYLSTHTFYDSCCDGYTKLLQKYGFDVILVSWDEKNREKTKTNAKRLGRKP